MYDLSASIVHKEPTYNDGSAPDQWLIVANCTADNGIGLGIIPKDDATGTITRQVTTHKYNALLSECSTKGNDR
ncbi:hypothetical protein GCM10017714_32660 [Curtobacterium pusillum]|nr:hypothetical protein GCM10017610_19850 [Curtobacterium pusillum]